MRNIAMKKQEKEHRTISKTSGIFLKKTFALLIAMIVVCGTFAFPVSAEGSSASVSLVLSRTTLNIGKTFTLTLKVTPNTSFPVASFDAMLQYDSSKFELIMESGNPKITRPSGVPSSFQMDASANGNQITMICADGTTSQNAPIKTSGATSLITFTFKVKDAAALGAANFQITECNVTKLENLNPISVPLTIAPPTAGTVAKRLDTNANLSELKTDIGTLSPAFSETVTSYKLDVATDKTAVVVTAKQESPAAKIAYAGGKNLAYGSNKVTVTVTAEDPDVVKVYTISVNRLSPIISSAVESSSEEISESSESTSSEESLNSSMSDSSFGSSSSTSSSEPTDPAKAALQFWKIIAFIFIGLFAVTAGALVWLLLSRMRERGDVVKKVRNSDEVVKIKRL